MAGVPDGAEFVSIAATSPAALGIGLIAEHRPAFDRGRRDEQSQKHDGAAPEAEQHAPAPAMPAIHENPPTDDYALTPATLFATTLIANRLVPATPSAEEVHLRTAHDWQAPVASLQLRDKTI